MKVVLATPISYKLDNKTGAPHFTGGDWLTSVLAQDYPDISYYILANDLKPEMLEVLKDGIDDRCILEHVELGNKPDRRGHRHGRKTKYARFATIRNLVLDYVLNTDAVYFVSIDSDVITHPDTVSRFVAHMQQRPEYGMIAAIVNNTRWGKGRRYPQAVYNFGRLHPPRMKTCIHLRKFPRGEFIDVDYTGACCCIRMEMLHKHPEIRWGEHVQGEDLYICDRIREAGYKIGVDTSLVTLHQMDDTTWREDMEMFRKGELI